MSERQDRGLERAFLREVRSATAKSWQAVLDTSLIIPEETTLFRRGIRVGGDEAIREGCSGLFYTQARDAYRSLIAEEGTEALSIPEIRQSFYDTGLTVLAELVKKYDTKQPYSKRSTYLGLINEYTPIVLLNSPENADGSAVALASREDDALNRCDLYVFFATGEYVPLQVKTDFEPSAHTIPDDGTIIYGADFFNSEKDITTSRLLLKQKRSPSEEQWVRGATSNLAMTLRQRSFLPPNQIVRRAQTTPLTHTSGPTTGNTIGEIHPQLSRLLEELSA